MKSHLVTPNRAVFFGDLFLIAVSVLAAFVLRLNFGARLADFTPQIITMIVIGWAIKPPIYAYFGLYRRVWEYASTQELKLITLAVTAASLVMFAAISIIQALRIFAEFPRAAVPIDYLLSLAFAGGLRFALRLLAESRTSRKSTAGRTRRVLVVGAGDAGALVVREMRKNPQVGLIPVGFADDDPAKQKQEIHGVRVLGTIKDLPRLVNTLHAEEVIFAIPSAPGRLVRTVTELCRQENIPFRTMPGLHELLGGKVSVNRLREVDITDLLRREPAQIDSQLVGLSLRDKGVLVTGAGGSIGSELCRQVARWQPAEMTLLGHGENSIFETLLELQDNTPNLPLYPVIADVRDPQRLHAIFAQRRPQIVFHAAAHKHVPLMEINVEEAITNNILGTRRLVETCLAFDVERLVMISTDKAICPSSVMGATKRLAEAIVLDAARRSGRPFSVVRFGNVLGSRGSVIHRFKRQILQGGPVTVTHPDMKRYFMTIPEAVHLVLQASAMGQGGEIFVLNMGEQIRIRDLAEDLIRLSGLEPGKDIEIVYTGIRPGEKLSETLWDEGANYQPTPHPDILRLVEDDLLNGSALQDTLDELANLAQRGDTAAILHCLETVIPGASIRLAPPTDLTATV